MNQGKPTKAKWWSRPRAQGTGADLTPEHMTAVRAPSGPEDGWGAEPGLRGGNEGPAEGSSAGQGEAAGSSAVVQDGVAGPAAEASAAVTVRAGATDAGGGDDGGDFELRRPDEAAPDDAAATDGDFELARPEGGAVRGASRAAVVREERGGEGDFELERPVAAATPAPMPVPAPPPLPAPGSAPASPPVPDSKPKPESVSGAVTETSSVPEAAGQPVPTDAVPASTAPAGDATSRPIPEADLPRGSEEDARAEAPAGVFGERPKPLHDPDPYSTPPYGEPGPWAPAPPVQHPGTPAHGTAVPQMPPPHGVPAAAAQVPAPVVPGPAASAAHGTTMPPASPQPSAPPEQGGTPVTSGTPAPAQGPGAAAPAPAPAQEATHPGGSPQPPAAHTASPPRDPWQNYDPWAAASGPLQQNGAAVPSKDQRRKRARKVLVLGALVLALGAGGIGGAIGSYLERNGGIGDVELPQGGDDAKGRAPDSVAGIAASALPSVVTLHVSGADAQGTGTGFVLDKRGHILTNNHVVEPAGGDGEISVTFSGGETAKATVVGRDTGYDLAVVKVTGVSGLKPLPLGNSDNVQVGDPVVAIGAPFELSNTVTSGIISAKERPITAGGEKGDGSDVSYVDALQTDAPINPGNSGGPLVDASARVIGINSAIRSAGTGSDLEGGQAGSIGLGFAIPINQGKRVAEELINTGRATHPVIGVTLDMDYAGDGARVGTENNDGGPPVNVGGPGHKAGIKAGDVITEVGGQRIHSGEELIVKIRAHRPGNRLELTLQRDGRARKVTLTLGSSGG
ncbi:trypsin-like peptidase domain-containing protein [Streptomyces acidicola]|uniref:trypsin-like peptidase domain-containing protein n=1 Tax=Streptomyces acidicola TaxID=2596892 RepID=UPI00382BF853